MMLLIALFAAASLEDVLTKMDAAAASFKGMAAQVSYTKLTAVVNDKSTESGGIFMQKSPKGYKVLIEFREPEKKTVLFANGKAFIYREKINVQEEYAVGDQRDVVDQFFQLGFGGGGHELTKSYGIAVDGDETVAGVATVKLTLAPKGKLKDVTKVELWISKEHWTPVQQRFTEGASKDYTEVTYLNVQEGPQPDKIFKTNANGKTRHVTPGK
jgi:outer membrane lipoprotein-sorting protein